MSEGEKGEVSAVLGLQWGDEGKGKLVDILAPQFGLVARFAGGNNAGHTVVIEGISYDFHLLPRYHPFLCVSVCVSVCVGLSVCVCVSVCLCVCLSSATQITNATCVPLLSFICSGIAHSSCVSVIGECCATNPCVSSRCKSTPQPAAALPCDKLMVWPGCLLGYRKWRGCACAWVAQGSAVERGQRTPFAGLAISAQDLRSRPPCAQRPPNC